MDTKYMGVETGRTGPGENFFIGRHYRHISFMQINIEFPQIVNHIAEVSHLTTLFSSSVNFYIYLLKHNHHLLSRNDQENSLVSFLFLFTFKMEYLSQTFQDIIVTHSSKRSRNVLKNFY